MKETILIYHGNCPDGFMAAVIFRKAAGENTDKIEFHAGVHQQAPPDVSGKKVVFVDFSYKRPVILEMARSAESILIVDHHASALEDLVDLPANVQTIFNTDRSGAGLAWETFMRQLPVPGIVLYIEAKDLQKFDAYPNVEEVIMCLTSYNYDFDLWTQFLDADQGKLITSMAAAGKSINRKQMKDIREAIEASWHELNIGGQRVPVVNLPYTMRLEAAKLLAKGQPFAACYYVADGYAYFELGSDTQGEDVSKIACRYGGGGHRHRAGFRVKYTGAELGEVLRQNPKSGKQSPGNV